MGCAERAATMILSEARGLWLFSVVRGGIGFNKRLVLKAPLPNNGVDTRPRTERFENRLSQRAENAAIGIASQHAQAACCFSSSGSKPAPFFQIAKTIAAIFRAKVRRAIDGFIPLSSKFR
jgi:hypothetical protein